MCYLEGYPTSPGSLPPASQNHAAHSWVRNIQFVWHQVLEKETGPA